MTTEHNEGRRDDLTRGACGGSLTIQGTAVGTWDDLHAPNISPLDPFHQARLHPQSASELPATELVKWIDHSASYRYISRAFISSAPVKHRPNAIDYGLNSTSIGLTRALIWSQPPMSFAKSGYTPKMATRMWGANNAGFPATSGTQAQAGPDLDEVQTEVYYIQNLIY